MDADQLEIWRANIQCGDYVRVGPHPTSPKYRVFSNKPPFITVQETVVSELKYHVRLIYPIDFVSLNLNRSTDD